MDTNKIKNYYIELANEDVKTGKRQFSNVNTFVDNCLSLAINSFWYAREWSFRRKEISVTISDDSGIADLPANFDGIIAVREEESYTGGSVIFVRKEDFDYMIPKLSAATNDYPQICTAYKDQDNATWKVQFYPPPSSGSDIKMLMLIASEENPANIPEKYIEGVLAYMDVYFYPIQSEYRLATRKEIEKVIDRLDVLDSIYKGKGNIQLSEQFKAERWWV